MNNLTEGFSKGIEIITGKPADNENKPYLILGKPGYTGEKTKDRDGSFETYKSCAIRYETSDGCSFNRLHNNPDTCDDARLLNNLENTLDCAIDMKAVPNDRPLKVFITYDRWKSTTELLKNKHF